MSEPAAPACDIPADEHEGPARQYPGGWLCSTHSPWRALGLPEPPPGLPARPRIQQKTETTP